MAKFNSPVYSTIRGSVGGLTYSANQFQSLIVRQRVSPVNPNTTQQSNVRSAFAGAETLWQGLSDSERSAWDDYASSLIFTGPLGTYTVPGRQVCIGNVGNALYLQTRGLALGTVDASPPLIPGFLDIADVDASTPASPSIIGIALTFTYTGSEDAFGYAVRSAAFSAARYSPKCPYNSSTLAGTAVTPPASGLIEFTGLGDGQIYFMKFRAITENPPFRLSALYYVRMAAVDTTP